MNCELIKLFGCAIEEPLMNVMDVEMLAISRGYLVDPRVCNKSVYLFLSQEPVDYNSTFYASWNDITRRSRKEILVDQIRHYLSTYGTDFSLGNGYVPRNAEDVALIPYEKYKYIGCVTRDEMFNRCHEFLKSDVALKSSTVSVLVDFILECTHGGIVVRDQRNFVESIKNREARVLLQTAWNVFPRDRFELLRFIIYRTTGKSMIIQNTEMIGNIKCSCDPFKFSMLNEEEMRQLSTIFLRYKNLFLAFKHNYYETSNKKYINKLRKMAIKNHTPMVKSVWDRITSDPSVTAKDIRAHIDEATIFRKITVLQALRYNIELAKPEMKDVMKSVIVRNGKLANVAYNPMDVNSKRIQEIAETIAADIISRLASKACIVKYPKGVDIKVPTSEKSFIGDYPIGTSYKLDNHNMIGIYWRNEWGTRDFDLSLMDVHGYRIGWNSSWNNHDIIYSGDMTKADPEATEIMYVKGNCPDCLIHVNRYNGIPGSKLRLFFAQEQVMNLSKNYMVNPNNIKLSVDLTSEKKEQNLGIIFDNEFHLINVQTGNGRISRTNQTDLLKYMRCKTNSFLSLSTVLEAAGFQDYDKVDREELLEDIEKGKVEILDLTQINRDTLINLFK